MGDIVDFAERKTASRSVLLCSCGCKSWIIYQNGTLECALCFASAKDSGKSWLEVVKVEKSTNDGNTTKTVIDFRNNKAALNSILDKIEYSKTNTILTFKNDGSISCWTSLNAHEQLDWLEECFKSAIEAERAKIRK